VSQTRLSVKPAILITLIVLVLDQLTKLLVRTSMEIFESIPILKSVFGDTFMFTYVQNSGASFSLSPFSPAGNRIFFVIVGFIAIGFIIYLMRRAEHRIQIIAFGLVIGGALGNMIDRIMIGSVTDFVDVDFPDLIMQRFPIFNVADSAIFIAMVLIIIDMFFIKSNEVSPAEIPVELEPEETDSTNKEI